MVGLPHRAEGVVDQRPRSTTAGGTARGEIPEAGAEVRATEHPVERDGEEENRPGDVTHRGVPDGFDGRSSRTRAGPYGTSISLAPAASTRRHRRAMLRSTRNVAVASSVYSTVTPARLNQTPSA